MSTIERLTPADAGCWIAGHLGHYGILRVVEIAAEHGMGVSADDARAMTAYREGNLVTDANGGLIDQYEIVVDLSDEAERWLNDNVAPEGFTFGWHDGEFYLWSDDDWNADA